MKRSRFQFFLVIGLLALLGVLAVLQYVWLGQISDAEKERVSRRLQTDTERFGEDFNREIQNAYLNFQADETLWQKKDWAQFNERYDFWREKTAYKNLIRDFYYFENKPDAPLLNYDPARRQFVEVNWTAELQTIRSEASDQRTFRTVNDDRFALVMAVYEPVNTFERILVSKVRKERAAPEIVPDPPTRLDLPEKKGFLVIKLDESVVKDQILPDLAKKHFPEGDFKLAVVSKTGRPIFQTAAVTAIDASVKIFDLAADNLLFFANKDLLPRSPKPAAQGVVISQNVKTHTFSTVETESFSAETLPDKPVGGTFEFKIKNNEKKPRTIMQTTALIPEGTWTLNVQHTAGSLDQFIANTRNRNLGISFGILGVLAVSILLIFVSANRARVLAQRQIDFVSSVSHEFRTPLAVIFSAGENLADGVAREETQVSRYGDLIKTEGRKLSAMVEQILEFAGANSGKKKYDFRDQSVGSIIETALDECRGMIEEKGFAVETEIAENLPSVTADAAALSRTVQNLIGNSLKYSKTSDKWLKISAKNGGGKIKIAVEDRGIGIAPKDLKHIFEPFFRAKAVVDEQIHGNGLGLSLVRETVEAHGGKISAESALGQGSKFTIELPPGKN
jgi:signal transduction histidine kinase